MPSTVKILRSTTPGATPTSLSSGQIAINEADGILFYRNAAGAVSQFTSGGGGGSPSVAVYASVSAFPATGSATVLYLAEDTSRLYQWESPVYVEVGGAGGGVIHAASHAAGGTDEITPASIGAATASHAHAAAEITGLANVATSGSAADLSGTLADARLSANVPILPGMLLYDHTPSACIETMPRYMTFFGTAGFTSGTIHYTFFTPLVTLAVSSITMHTVSTAASGLTMARMGLFTWNETTATLVARTANDTTLFTATRTGYTRNLDTAGGFPATYTLQAGTRYAVGVICVGTTMPTLSAISCLSEIYARTPRMGGSMSNQSDLSTINVTGNTGLTIYARLQ